jgi:hypothetical protein
MAVIYDDLAAIALGEFADIVRRAEMTGRRAATPLKLRLYLRDETLLDIWLNPTATDFAYHWEQRAKRGLIHRFDNAPDFPHLSTFPKHFHNGTEDIVIASDLPDVPAEAVRVVLNFILQKLVEYERRTL